MRIKSKNWNFIDNSALFLYNYSPINENQAKIKGVGKIWNDQVRSGDYIIINTKDSQTGKLFVDEVKFTNHDFEAIVTLLDKF